MAKERGRDCLRNDKWKQNIYIFIVFKSIRILRRRGQEVHFPLTTMILKEFVIDFIQKDSQHTPPFSAIKKKRARERKKKKLPDPMYSWKPRKWK